MIKLVKDTAQFNKKFKNIVKVTVTIIVWFNEHRTYQKCN